MILFFGTRPGKPETTTLLNSTCPYCQQQGTLTAVTQKNYFHLFWIKLFKISTNNYIECSHCKRLYYENEFTDEMNRELSRIKK
ncbi:zinc-ribbon domain-containing protein [uncultured Maribacter sp.]|uniref:zinc-ribbon domain-containing protein n=1 Tax=uncultured Maribacter sp. TaxID=431308 RepID=UPI0030EE986B